MRYSWEDVRTFVQEEDVRFIHLVFCDVFGRQKNIAILPSELSRAVSFGIAIDASAIAGFGGTVHSDLLLHPIPDSLTLLPWRPEQGKLVELRCFVTYPDGRIFENDTRSILRDAVRRAEKAGLAFSFGPELEFYLFCLDDDGAKMFRKGTPPLLKLIPLIVTAAAAVIAPILCGRKGLCVLFGIIGYLLTLLYIKSDLGGMSGDISGASITLSELVAFCALALL